MLISTSALALQRGADGRLQMSVILKGRGNNGATSCAFRPLAQFMCGGSSLSHRASVADASSLLSQRHSVQTRSAFVCVSADASWARKKKCCWTHPMCSIISRHQSHYKTQWRVDNASGRSRLLQTNLARQQRRRTLVAISAAAFIKRENWSAKELLCSPRTTQ